jgi:leader peptidase (prepilin peptidase)/N-methyltransferase
VLPLTGAVLGLVLGPWLATTTVRLAGSAHRSLVRIAVTSVLAAAAGAAAPVLAGDRPAAVAFAWFGAAAVVLAGVDLICHRLPDRVTYPAYVVCGSALLVDAAVHGTWGALLTAVAAGAASLLLGALGWVVSPQGMGLGDVKLLGLLGLVLGWFGWGVLMAGVFLGLLTGALVSVLLLATRRAGWRTAIPFGPPLLAGAVLALALGAVLPG